MNTMLTNIIRYLFAGYKTTQQTSFFDYSAKEKRRIIVAASKKAAKEQAETLKKYDRSRATLNI